MVRKADIVICGAGVVGASVAYFLSLRGIRPLVIERERVAYGASGTAAGLLSPLAPSEAETPAGKLLARSMQLHGQLAETLDGPRRYDYAPMDSLVLARGDADLAALRAAWGEAVEIAPNPTAWVDREVAGHIRQTGAAQLDPGKFTATLLEEACARGAEVMSGDVQGLRTESGAVSAVIVSAETVETPRVVVAMGPWSREADGWLRTPLPVIPLKGQILRYRIEGAPAGGFSTMDGNYAVRKPTGIVYAGTTEEEAGFELAPTAEGRSEIEAWIRSVSSVFDGAEPFEQTACLRPLSADGLPLIGPAPAIEGAFVATGHGRKGIMLSTATGEALAELITTGRCTTLDLAPFDPGRFRAVPGGSQ